MQLFRLTKKMPDNWFNDTHKAITECDTHSELNDMRNAIEMGMNCFNVGHRDKYALALLLAYCNIRYRFMTNRINKFNNIYKPKQHGTEI